jgi:hypothetical protein
VKLFTIDVRLENLELENEQPFMSQKEKKIQRVRDRIKRNNLREGAFSNQTLVAD